MRNGHLGGFLFGVGAAGLGFYLYKRNQSKVDAFLRRHGIELPGPLTGADAGMSLEALVLEKERLEDLIAEREHAALKDAGNGATDG